MDKLKIHMAGSEITKHNTNGFGEHETIYSFNFELFHLKVGSFSGSKIELYSTRDGTVRHSEMQLAAWKRFVHVLDGARSLIFAYRTDPYQKKWFEGRTSKEIPWLDLRAYDAARQVTDQSYSSNSIQIHKVSVGSSLPTIGGLDWASLTYKGITKVWW